MSNRLINEQSPYLLQHAHNPVDWYPWGEQAFEAAVRYNKPVFLSVGYAACHWCHVMERESFQDPRAAAALNDSFVCVKVDREERPDVDAAYMAVCQMLNGSGGWPLSIVMTADKRPFFAATYLPRESRFGRIGVIDLARRIRDLAETEPERIEQAAAAIAERWAGAFHFESDPDGIARTEVLDQAWEQIVHHYDARFGGFDAAPKFPMPHRLDFLMDMYIRTRKEKILAQVRHTLTAMRLGGVWDHVGHGFHRYSTDSAWLLPHFEKMLYDQALLARTYLKAYEITHDPLFRRTAMEIFDYALREMRSPEGGFYAARDADSEGVEGKFYLWPHDLFQQTLASNDAAIPWARLLNVLPDGNFLEEATRRKTGDNILHLKQSLDDWANDLRLPSEELWTHWERARSNLFAVRAQRVAPLLDDKIMTDWNGLMIAALSTGGRVLQQDHLIRAAVRAAVFILAHHVDGQGRLLHCRRPGGGGGLAATANDHAFFISGLLALYETTGEKRWLRQSVEFMTEMNDGFRDVDGGGFYLTAKGQNDLPVRPKELYDGAAPCANAVTLNNLVLLSRLTNDGGWLDQARELIAAFAGSVQRQPAAFTHTLTGWNAFSQAVGGEHK